MADERARDARVAILAEANTRARIKALEHDLDRQRIELASYSRSNEARIVSSDDREKQLRRIRSADPAASAATGELPTLARRRGTNGSGLAAKKDKPGMRHAS